MSIRYNHTDHIILELLHLELAGENYTQNNRIWGLLEIVTEDRQGELAELCIEFCERHNLLLPFITHIVQYEINNTKDLTVLFREDSFAIKCVHRLLFCDIGRKYLKLLTVKFIRDVITNSLWGEAMDTSVANMRDLCKSVTETSLELLLEFVSIFEQHVDDCPIVLRQVFCAIQNGIENKFPGHAVPLVIDFLFFKYICTALINPKKYRLMEEDDEISSSSARSLVNMSKILNNLAHNLGEKYEQKEYREFIEVNHPRVIGVLNKLIDPKEIEKVKNNTTPQPEATSAQQSVSEKKLRTFLDSIMNRGTRRSNRVTRRSTILTSDLEVVPEENIIRSEVHDQKLVQLCEIIQASDWTKKKDHKSYSMSSYFVKVEDTSTVKLKVEFKVNVALVDVFDYVTNLENLKIIIGDMYLGHEMYTDQTNYREYRCMYRMPFPLNNRDTLYCQWNQLEDDRAVVVTDNMDTANASKYPRAKGFVRAVSYLCGWYLEKDMIDCTKVVVVSHMNPQGFMPIWLTNSMSANLASTAAKFAECVEAFYKNK